MKYLVPGLVVLLLILHQDDWFFNFWKEPDLMFGFIPGELLFHAGISLAAGITWFLAVRFCWPNHLDEETSSSEEGESAA